MKRFSILVAALMVLAGMALAQGINGKFLSERKMERDGQAFVIKQVYDLKTEGGKLTGTVAMSFGDMEPRSSEIKDGKVDGNKFTFTTVMQGPNGEMKVVYTGTLEGDTLKGASAREGGQERPFEAKKQ
jgi:hypothetical protein